MAGSISALRIACFIVLEFRWSIEEGRASAARLCRPGGLHYMNRYPALHNAMWPGLVGKGPDSEPPIDLDTMIGLTAAAEVNGVKFEGVDLFLFDPHVNIDSSD